MGFATTSEISCLISLSFFDLLNMILDFDLISLFPIG